MDHLDFVCPPVNIHFMCGSKNSSEVARRCSSGIGGEVVVASCSDILPGGGKIYGSTVSAYVVGGTKGAVWFEEPTDFVSSLLGFAWTVVPDGENVDLVNGWLTGDGACVYMFRGETVHVPVGKDGPECACVSDE